MVVSDTLLTFALLYTSRLMEKSHPLGSKRQKIHLADTSRVTIDPRNNNNNDGKTPSGSAFSIDNMLIGQRDNQTSMGKLQSSFQHQGRDHNHHLQQQQPSSIEQLQSGANKQMYGPAMTQISYQDKSFSNPLAMNGQYPLISHPGQHSGYLHRHLSVPSSQSGAINPTSLISNYYNPANSFGANFVFLMESLRSIQSSVGPMTSNQDIDGSSIHVQHMGHNGKTGPGPDLQNNLSELFNISGDDTLQRGRDRSTTSKEMIMSNRPRFNLDASPSPDSCSPLSSCMSPSNLAN